MMYVVYTRFIGEVFVYNLNTLINIDTFFGKPPMELEIVIMT